MAIFDWEKFRDSVMTFEQFKKFERKKNMTTKPSDKELLKWAVEIMNQQAEIIRELDEGYYTSSDLILYGDDLVRLIEGEIEEQDLEERIKNLKLFLNL